VPFLLLGVLGFWIVLAATKAFARANPASLARLFKQGGGMLALMAALGLLLIGRLGLAVAVGGFGFWLLGAGGLPNTWFHSVGRGGNASRNSRVKSAMIEMELDHETGKMNGRILSGPDQGKWLDDLTRPQCEAVYGLCRTDDPDGARLVEAYLDRRFPGWGAADESNRDAGRGDGSGGQRGGAMSEEQAYQILGLQKGAPREAIIRSHHTLMKKLHPDHGGPTDLAAQVNEAKDVLLRRHV
jgi:hypothetical protein